MRRFAVTLLVLWVGCDEDRVVTDSGAADASDAAVETSVDAPPPSPGPGVEGAAAQWIEVDATNVYWVGTYGEPFAPSRLWSAPKAGGTPKLLVDPSADGSFGQVFALAQDDTDLFFFVTHGSQTGSPITVNRVSKAGGDVTVLAQFTLLPFAIDLATDGVDLFWLTDDGVVHRTPASGGQTEPIFQGALVSVSGRQMVLDAPAHRIYVPTASGIVAIDTVTKATTPVTSQLAGLQLAHVPGGMVFVGAASSTFWLVSGTQASDLGIDPHLAVQGLASDGQTLWWFHDGVGAPSLTDGALSSAPVGDGGAESIVSTGLESLETYGDSVTFDEAHVYFSASVVLDAGVSVPHIFVVPR